MKLKPEKNSGLKGFESHDLCDTGAVLCQLSSQAIWELKALWVLNIYTRRRWRIYETSYIYLHFSSCNKSYMWSEFNKLQEMTAEFGRNNWISMVLWSANIGWSCSSFEIYFPYIMCYVNLLNFKPSSVKSSVLKTAIRCNCEWIENIIKSRVPVKTSIV